MNTRPLRNGLTLVEMLVATAVTLLLVAGLAQAFQAVSVTVSSQRAGLVMAGQLRSVSMRLQRDLVGLTAAVGPYADPLSGNGYFEYREGTSHDGTTRTTIGMLPDLTAFGDGDDVLMFTSRSSDSQFTGIYETPASAFTVVDSLASQLAEIAWWGTLTDHNDNGALDVEEGDDFTIYRRALLIRPDLNVNAGPTAVVGQYFRRLGGGMTFDTTNATDMMTLARLVRDFYNNNDLSVRFVRNPPGTGGTVAVFVVANSLQDLTDRRHRFAHAQIVDAGFNYRIPTFPYDIDRSNSVTGLPAFRYPDPLNPSSERGVVKSGARQGEDVVLAHATALDVRAFDPRAVLSFHPSTDGGWGVAAFDDDGDGTPDDPSDLTVEQDEAGWVGSDDEVVGPGEAGYGVLPGGGSTLAVSTGLGSILPAGRGAYVDLFYQGKVHGTSDTYDLLPGMALLRSHFSRRDQPVVTGSTTRLAMPTYDTWPRQYEYDGVDQDGDGLTDEGTDGLDTNAMNGVDDRAELETSPPYLFPLRGIQVRIRMIDHDSRQVRQSTVESSFVPD